MHAPAHVVEAELGVRGGDPDVAGQRELYAAAHHHAVQGGDDRLVDSVQPPGDPARESLVEHVATQIGTSAQPAVDMRGEVRAGAERLLAVSGKDGQAYLRVVAEAGPRVEEQTPLRLRARGEAVKVVLVHS